jgi:hypothetical protein
VLRGGYLSWHDPVGNHWWQSVWFSGDAPTFRDLGPLDGTRGSLRSQIDRLTPVPALVEGLPAGGAVLSRAASGASEIERSAAARAEALREQIAEIKRAASQPD